MSCCWPWKQWQAKWIIKWWSKIHFKITLWCVSILQKVSGKYGFLSVRAPLPKNYSDVEFRQNFSSESHWKEQKVFSPLKGCGPAKLTSLCWTHDFSGNTPADKITFGATIALELPFLNQLIKLALWNTCGSWSSENSLLSYICPFFFWKKKKLLSAFLLSHLN